MLGSMTPKEVWLRYACAKRNAASLLQEVVQGASENFEDVVDAMEIVFLWKQVVSGNNVQLSTETFGQMVEATENWKVKNDG